MGFDSLTPGQKQVVREIAFQRRDAYLGLPTNWGKSIVAIATALLSKLGHFDHHLKEGQDVMSTLLVVPSQVYINLYPFITFTLTLQYCFNFYTELHTLFVTYILFIMSRSFLSELIIFIFCRQ
jgi:hypothetical protein